MQFVLIGLDGIDAESSNRRQAAREAHIAKGDELLKKGNLLYGATLLHDDGSMKGSMYVLNFESEELLHEYLKSEPYVSGDVWRDITIHKSNTRESWFEENIS
jgi:uncharacterized protein